MAEERILEIDSGHITEARWSQATKKLVVEFATQKTYEYHGVSKNYIDAMESSSSPVRYLNTIIARKHKYQRI